jgi:N-acyl-L-homoserine lactone synthetase
MASAGNKHITNEAAVPVVESDIFVGHENKRYATCVFSAEDVLNYKSNSIIKAYLRLRANVYVDQTGMLEDHAKQSDGTELDIDDERSTHFVVLENRMGRVAVFACMRFIEKTADKNSELPIEEFFPDAFSEKSPQNSIEVSRFIARHDEARQCLLAKRELMTAGLAHALEYNLGPVFGVVEPGFEKALKLMGVPTRRIAEPVLVPEYNDENLGLEVDTYGFRDKVGQEAIDRMTVPVGSFVYWGKNSTCNQRIKVGEAHGEL